MVCSFQTLLRFLLSFPSSLSFPAPCCPATLNVTQVTQAMSNVTWSAAQGAQSFVASLTSSRGNATCHTIQTKCMMGCITCGANYTVSLQAIDSKGNTAVCMYHGFSTSELHGFIGLNKRPSSAKQLSTGLVLSQNVIFCPSSYTLAFKMTLCLGPYDQNDHFLVYFSLL